MKAIKMLEDIMSDKFSDEAKQWIIEAHNELKTIKQLNN